MDHQCTIPLHYMNDYMCGIKNKINEECKFLNTIYKYFLLYNMGT